MSELIDRQALRAAHGLGSDCHDCKRDMKSCQYDRDYSLMDFCEWLDDAPTASPWHRVEEELPKDYGDYLGYANGEVMFLLFNPDAKDKWKWSACDAEGCFDVSMDEVTHWMPLPEPPKEDE